MISSRNSFVLPSGVIVSLVVFLCSVASASAAPTLELTRGATEPVEKDSFPHVHSGRSKSVSHRNLEHRLFRNDTAVQCRKPCRNSLEGKMTHHEFP